MEDRTDYEALADRAERGEIAVLGRAYTGDGSRIDLGDIFVPTGRPRAEQAYARRTWKVRAPEELDEALEARAHSEDMPKSALIRKAVADYLAHA